MSKEDSDLWRIRVDTGGTFTDCWALAPGNTVPRYLKVLSSGELRLSCPEDTLEIPRSWELSESFFRGWSRRRIGRESVSLSTGETAPQIGMRILTQTPLGDAFPPIDLRLATTRGTNALLEGKGDATVLLVTRGFADLLLIGDQRRPDLFSLSQNLPSPIPVSTIEVEGRLDAAGHPLSPLSLSQESRRRLSDLVSQGVRHAAVALLHSYRNPTHEKELEEILQTLGFDHVSLSSELAPLIKILPRTETAVVDSTLTPVLGEFLDQVQSSGADLKVMTSSGSLLPRRAFRPKDSLFSGPAGGVVGAAAIGRRWGRQSLIAFDMGGTSTDVARYDGKFDYHYQQRVGNASLFAPALRIETVAAGGGSICQMTSEGLRVGPESAGAQPGPACYGNGGPLCITDVNLLLGRIQAENFGIPLGDDQLAAARTALTELMEEAGAAQESERDFLLGLLDIAVEQMADRIRGITLREGIDPSQSTLLAFGGAGPLHGCAVADRLGITSILVPREAGLLSAYGLHQAKEERITERQILELLHEVDLPKELRALAERNDDSPGWEVTRQIAEIRLLGQESALQVEVDTPDAEALRVSFYREFSQRFAYPPPTGKSLELVTLRVVSSQVSAEESEITSSENGIGDRCTGPSLRQDRFSTLFVAEGWVGEASDHGDWLLERTSSEAVSGSSARPSTVQAELFRHRFETIVHDMGVMLERSAISTNVKERLDFSCALLNAEGELVVNAPHIPVHLGALGLCVRTLQRHGFLEGEESIVTNHPAFGGSHLPDVTMVTPVRVHGELLGFIANRAHHAEIGGCRPGSMPPDARTLVEEGVVIPPTPFSEVIQGSLFRDGPFPTRNWLDNEADLYAQQAANQRGRQALLALAEKHSAELVASELNHLIQRAHQNLRQTLSDRGIAKRSVESHLDDGTRICLSAERTAAGLSFDFAGTSSCHPGNLNATEAIVRSALLYVLRLWSGADLPLNEGFLRGVSVHLPENSFLSPLFSEDPADCPAVVGGNVETSQRLVDTLLSLFGLCAESQGTMNNLLFGNESFGYYETIGGGSGAGPSFPGTSGRHCHMTNTAITDPEILEHRYPVRLREFSLRRGSGGVGRFQGGDGLRRAIEFLEPLEVSLLTQQRKTGPRGSEGGVDAAPGRQRLFRAKGEGSGEILPAITALSAGKGDWLLLETPGGGGWGNPDEPPTEVETSETSPASLPSPPSDASSAPR